MVRINERKTKHNRQWWDWIHGVINYRVHSIKTVRLYYMELGLGAFSNMDRGYPRCFVIGGADYFG